ncbi:uncharacterized conserved protein [Sanguibacter keddieii DSM 10542]|uniref:Uncharacterized conserved protein n=1 Tax=Sanguibacter keddieii (strain ATCC 51767 / DSM 10542 / NCFB 3025 / ST-74) TaxID=446469 RepID=D1BCN1_SANKS|nr:DUF58 domain-containing protein [Sanguibacter keddieii]ACZ20879.1 uncharacterized conserved protein [Sanguibacter keddieii DSM 10542]
MVLTWRAVALAALGVVPVLLTRTVATVLLWAVVVALVAAVDAALAASPRDVSVQRTVPRAVRLTEHARSTLVLRNGSRRRFSGVVRDAWQPSAGAQGDRHPLDLPPGEQRRTVTVLVPTRRGDRRADRVTLRALGPLGVAGRQASIPVPGTLRVLPEFASRRHLPSRLARLRELDGQAAVQIRGEGTEFDSLREYVIGDDVRSIDWRASARGQEMVVRTWRPERDRRVLVVLDTARTSAARIGDQPRLDASIEAGLLLGALASKAGDRVEMVAYDRELRARVAGAAGPRLLPALADAMAPLEASLVETDWPGLVALVRERLSQRSLVVILSTLEPAAIETGLLPVVEQLTAHHTVVLASVADPAVAALREGRSTAAEVFDAAAAERTELERAAATMVLGRRGVDVVSALPDELAPRLADTYLSLKAAGRL